MRRRGHWQASRRVWRPFCKAPELADRLYHLNEDENGRQESSWSHGVDLWQLRSLWNWSIPASPAPPGSSEHPLNSPWACRRPCPSVFWGRDFPRAGEMGREDAWSAGAAQGRWVWKSVWGYSTSSRRSPASLTFCLLPASPLSLSPHVGCLCHAFSPRDNRPGRTARTRCQGWE